MGVTVATLFEKLKQQEYRCAVSGRTLTPDNCEVDHVVPLANGGKMVYDNIHLVVSEVNRAKGTMPLEDFVSLCEDVVQYSRERGLMLNEDII